MRNLMEDSANGEVSTVDILLSGSWIGMIVCGQIGEQDSGENRSG